MSSLKITDQMIYRYLDSDEYRDDYIPEGNDWSSFGLAPTQNYDECEVDDEGCLVTDEE